MGKLVTPYALMPPYFFKNTYPLTSQISIFLKSLMAQPFTQVVMMVCFVLALKQTPNRSKIFTGGLRISGFTESVLSLMVAREGKTLVG